MLNLVLLIGIGLFGLCLVMNLIRLMLGPDITDRILALDSLMINSIALLVLTDLYLRLGLLLEVGLLIALMGFVGTLAMTKFLLRGDVIE